MVYETGFTTRRTYTSRPVVTSYAVSYPIVTGVSRVYKTSYPIYSTKSYTRRTGVTSSPVRIVTSPSRVITRLMNLPSPVRVTRMTTTRVVRSPEHISSYVYTTPTTYTSPYIPSTYYSSYTPHISSYKPRYTAPYIPSTYFCSSPSYLYSSPVTRIYSRSLTPVGAVSSPARVTPSYLKRTLPGYGTRLLTNYLSTEPFTTFREETARIRNRAQSLIRDLHTPIIRRARSMTPFPVTGYEPSTNVAFDAYVSRITNPVRHIAKEVHRMSMYPETAQKYTDPELDPHRPSRKFSAPRPLDDPFEDEAKEKQRLRYERLMTITENKLDTDELEKKNAQIAADIKGRIPKVLNEKAKRKVEEPGESEARLAEDEKKHQEEELKRLAALEKQAEAEKRALEEEQKRKAAEEEKKQLEEEDKLAEEGRLAEDIRKVAEARLAEEIRLKKNARLAEEAALKAAEAARLAEEQSVREAEIKRLAEIEKQAEEDREAELARQAAELAEIARQDAEIAIQEQQNIQQAEEAETTADSSDAPVAEEPAFAEVEKQKEPTIDLNISSGNTDVVHVTTEEETEEE